MWLTHAAVGPLIDFANFFVITDPNCPGVRYCTEIMPGCVARNKACHLLTNKILGAKPVDLVGVVIGYMPPSAHHTNGSREQREVHRDITMHLTFPLSAAAFKTQ